MNKETAPTESELAAALGATRDIWQEIVDYTTGLYPRATTKWNYSGSKYGWSFRVSDAKRVLVYMLPRSGFFKVSMVFGQKATEQILRNDISEDTKAKLREAKVYAEGRGIRLEIRDDAMICDVKKLIAIKVSN